MIKETDDERYFSLFLIISGGTLINGHYPTFQFQEKNNTQINFDIIKDHKEIMEEIYNIFKSKIK